MLSKTRGLLGEVGTSAGERMRASVSSSPSAVLVVFAPARKEE